MDLGIGKRIKDKRIELGLSQKELAHRMGYKSEAAISKVEHGEDNITTDRISKFAKALNCSPGYLMGWEDYTPPEGTRTFVNPHKIHVTDEEEKIILAYRVADDFDQRFVRRILNIDDGEKENSLNA
jgi:transcriptional regulator with XRE-family HTH domain